MQKGREGGGGAPTLDLPYSPRSCEFGDLSHARTHAPAPTRRPQPPLGTIDIKACQDGASELAINTQMIRF